MSSRGAGPGSAKSSVSCSAEQLAAWRGRWAVDEVAVAHHVHLEPEGWRPVRSAMSSMEQMLMVDSVNGMPNALGRLAHPGFLHRRAASPVRPVGAIATGMVYVPPHHGGAGGTALPCSPPRAGAA